MRRRAWLSRLSPALAAGWSFSGGIGTTYRAFATGAAATQVGRRAHRSQGLFEEHPALRRRCRPCRGDLGLGHSGRRCGDGLHDQGAAEHRAVQYRPLTHCRWQLGADSYDHKNYGHVLTQTQSGTFAVRPRGPLGVITARLKPEGAARLARASMHELINVKIGLRNIFTDHDIALLEERVMECGSSSERIARVENFLLQNFREDREESVFSRASCAAIRDC